MTPFGYDCDLNILAGKTPLQIAEDEIAVHLWLAKGRKKPAKTRSGRGC